MVCNELNSKCIVINFGIITIDNYKLYISDSYVLYHPYAGLPLPFLMLGLAAFLDEFGVKRNDGTFK